MPGWPADGADLGEPGNTEALGLHHPPGKAPGAAAPSANPGIGGFRTAPLLLCSTKSPTAPRPGGGEEARCQALGVARRWKSSGSPGQPRRGRHGRRAMTTVGAPGGSSSRVGGSNPATASSSPHSASVTELPPALWACQRPTAPAGLAAAAVISEIGVDVTGFFPGDAHLASWTGLCPGNCESAGKRRSGRRRHGNEHLQSPLVECAWAAVRHDGYLKSLYHRHVMKRGRLPQLHRQEETHHRCHQCHEHAHGAPAGPCRAVVRPLRRGRWPGCARRRVRYAAANARSPRG